MSRLCDVKEFSSIKKNDIEDYMKISNMVIDPQLQNQLRNWSSSLDELTINVEEWNCTYKQKVIKERVVKNKGEDIFNNIEKLFEDIQKNLFDTFEPANQIHKHILEKNEITGLNPDIRRDFTVSTQKYKEFFGKSWLDKEIEKYSKIDLNVILFTNMLKKIHIANDLFKNVCSDEHEFAKWAKTLENIFDRMLDKGYFLTCCVDWFAVNAYMADGGDLSIFISKLNSLWEYYEKHCRIYSFYFNRLYTWMKKWALQG